MIAIRIIIEKKSKDKVIRFIKDNKLFCNILTEEIKYDKDNNGFNWVFNLDVNIISHDYLTLFSTWWYIAVTDNLIESCIAKDSLKIKGTKWVNIEML